MRKAVPSKVRLAVYIYYIAHSSSFQVTGEFFGLGSSTVGEILDEIVSGICFKMGHFISLPSAEEFVHIAASNEQKYKIPQCTLFGDGSHIPILPPHQSPESYFNRKCFYSINILAFVDHRQKIRDLVVGYPGKCGDARIFRNSHLGHQHQEILGRLPERIVTVGENETAVLPMFLLGDSAFANTKHFVTTFETNEINRSISVKRLNRRLAGMRYIVENTFGVLKCRWRILMNKMNYGQHNISKVSLMITSIIILHNFLIDINDELDINNAECREMLQEYKRKYTEPAQQINEENQLTSVENSNARSTLARYCDYYNLINDN